MGRAGGGVLIRRPGTAAAALAALLLAAGGAAAVAQPMPVPPKLQMAIFKKVFQYDRTLAGKPVQVLVVHDGGTGELHDLLASFEFAQIPAAPVHFSQLAERLDDASVVYVLSGVPTSAYLEPCAERAILSISGHPSLVQRGNVSIAVGLRGDGKPEVIVHRGRLKAEKHDISAELLKVARVLQ